MIRMWIVRGRSVAMEFSDGFSVRISPSLVSSSFSPFPVLLLPASSESDDFGRRFLKNCQTSGEWGEMSCG